MDIEKETVSDENKIEIEQEKQTKQAPKVDTEEQLRRQAENKIQAEDFKTKGNEHFKNKSYLPAVESYTKAINYYDQEPSYFGNRAACYLALKKFHKCIEDCDKALRLDSKFVKALRRKALSLVAIGSFEEAIRNFEEALAHESDKQIKVELEEAKTSLSNYNKLVSYMEEGNWNQSVVYINALILKYPESPSLQMKQVEIKAKVGSTDEAMKLLNDYYNNWDNARAEIYYLKGIIALYSGQEGAKKHFIEGMKFDPDNTKCRLALNIAKKSEKLKDEGNEAIKSKDYKKCIELYTESISVDPNNRKLNAISYSNRGLAFLRSKEHKQAIADFTKSIELDNKYAKSYLRKAEALQELGEFEEALRAYNCAKEADPSQNLKSLIEDCKRKLAQSKKKDYYAILGVPRTADDKEIKKAYRKLAVQWHPDKHLDDKDEAAKKFKDIGEAYAVLSDPKKKQMFDQGVDPNDEQASHGHGGDFGGVDPNQIFQMFFGGGGGGRGGFPGNVRFSQSGGGDDDFGGFGGGFGGFRYQ